MLVCACGPSMATSRPSFQYVGSRACGDLLVFTAADRGREQLVVELDRKRAWLTIGTQTTFDLAKGPLKIHVDMYDEIRAARTAPTCSRWIHPNRSCGTVLRGPV
jgi:hypothetical protein